jgi:hypothetical protein
LVLTQANRTPTHVSPQKHRRPASSKAGLPFKEEIKRLPNRRKPKLNHYLQNNPRERIANALDAVTG